MSQGLVARDVQGLKLLILAGPSPHCPLSPCHPAGRAGIGELGCSPPPKKKRKKKVQPHLFPPSIIFGIDANRQHRRSIQISALQQLPRAGAHPLRASVSPRAKLHTGTNATPTPPSASFPAAAGRQIHRATGIHNKTHLHFPALALLLPASSSVFMFCFLGNKRLVTMRRATAQRLVKFVTHML